VLSFLAALFLLRVVGQALVAFADVRFLPPMSEWYSGLLPYPILLPTQLAILVVQAWIAYDFARGRGVFVTARPRIGRAVVALGFVYFAVMVARYVLTMTWHPERRWLGTGTIPIVFHWILAAYLVTLGRYHARAATA
jgi:hypothetical protein